MGSANHQDREHALLAPSSAARILKCPGSVRATEHIPEDVSPYAEEGTLAHEIGELKVRKRFIEPIGPQSYKKRHNAFAAHPMYHPEMESCTDEYVELIEEIAMQHDTKPTVLAEVELDISAYVPECFGHSDTIVYSVNRVDVVDYKHGKGIHVPAEENPQMLLYALGAIDYLKPFIHPTTIGLHVCQPRNGGCSSWVTTKEYVLQWAEDIKPIMQKAYDGCDEFHSGEHCKKCFCKIRWQCRTRATEAALDAFGLKQSNLLTDAELAEVLAKAKLYESWVDDVRTYCIGKLSSGEEIPGWKLVEGRSKRTITDADKAIEHLDSNGYPKAMFYETHAIPLTEMERVVGKKKFGELMKDYITKPPGKPTLADESDKREPINAAVLAFKNT